MRAAIRYNNGLELQAELVRFNADPALQEWVSGTLDRLLEQTRRDAAAIHATNLKIQALTLELAQLRRMRFGVRSEALSAEQRGTVRGDARERPGSDRGRTGGAATNE